MRRMLSSVVFSAVVSGWLQFGAEARGAEDVKCKVELVSLVETDDEGWKAVFHITNVSERTMFVAENISGVSIRVLATELLGSMSFGEGYSSAGNPVYRRLVPKPRPINGKAPGTLGAAISFHAETPVPEDFAPGLVEMLKDAAADKTAEMELSISAWVLAKADGGSGIDEDLVRFKSKQSPASVRIVPRKQRAAQQGDN